jgi:hypothetical protein
MRTRGSWLAAGLLVTLGLGLGLLLSALPGSDFSPAVATAGAQDRMPAGKIVLTFSVGGVLTTDGRLLQYRPDVGRWLPIDEAFRQEGRETHILPLPVPPGEIRQMESFGFIVTKSGESWLYEMATDQWRRLPEPS